MLEMLSSFHQASPTPQPSISPVNGGMKKVLMENAATFKTAYEKRYILPTYTKLQLAKKNRSKFASEENIGLVEGALHKKQR